MRRAAAAAAGAAERAAAEVVAGHAAAGGGDVCTTMAGGAVHSVDGLDELLQETLADAGYVGVEVFAMPSRTEIIIRATRVRAVLGIKGRRIRELAAVVQERFGLLQVELFGEQA